MQKEPLRLETKSQTSVSSHEGDEPAPLFPPPMTTPPEIKTADQSKRSKRPRLLVVTLMVGVVVMLVASVGVFAVLRHPTKTSSSPTTAIFHPAPCLFLLGAGLTQGKDVRCGSLTVTEDHSHPQGATIQLSVAIFKAAALHPAPDPVVYLSGGPGGGVVEALGSALTAASLAVWPGDRDLILFDQRGTGASRPSLACPELTTAPSDALVEAMGTCHDRLMHEGVQLSVYTTEQNAADVHALMQALGYQKINLYGGSYGTRLALTVMRLFPTDIRSVILDSAFPPQVNLFVDLAPGAQRGFDTLFTGCAASPTCNSRYPNLQAIFAQVVTDLDHRPVPMELSNPWTGQRGVEKLTGMTLVAELRAALYQTALIPKLPMMLYQLQQHDYTLVSQISAQVSFGGINWGMFFSVECGEDMAFTTLTALEASVKSVRLESRAFFQAYTEQSYQICQFWGAPQAPAVQKQAVRGTIPTLILAGEYDPTTPPANGRLAAQTLSRSYFFLFPGVGHGIQHTSQCADGIIYTFQEHPESPPNGSCIGMLSEPNFG